MGNSRLFEPLKLGNMELKQRIAMAPLTRLRADENHVILPMVTEHYKQRACTPGTLLISEATFISKEHSGYLFPPGIFNQAQINAWKTTTDAVHEQGSYIFCQLWALGRVADPEVAKTRSITIKSSSATQLQGKGTPQEMTHEDIRNAIAVYAQAAKNAIAAGFDGVELHGANGYLIDQFTQDVVNKRTDEYGGSIANRSRFAVEVTQAVAEAIGAERVGLRLSPFTTFQGTGMQDPYPQFIDVIKKINPLGLAYLHLIEARVDGITEVEHPGSISPFVEHFDGPVLLAGGYTLEVAKKTVDEDRKDKDVVIVFGRYFISNPDLAFRLKEGIELTPYRREDFYRAGQKKGYTDYAFSDEWLTKEANSQA